MNMYVYTIHVPGAAECQKRGSVPQDWKCSMVGAGNQSQVLCKSSKWPELLSLLSSLTFIIYMI